MLVFIEIRFTEYFREHCSRGIKELVISNSLEEAVDYIVDEHAGGSLYEDETDGMFVPSEKFFNENLEKFNKLSQYNLKIEEVNRRNKLRKAIVGRRNNLNRFLESNDWEEAEENKPKFDWSNNQEISEADAEVLLRLKIVKDIR